jgi:hypothetical protein
MTTEQRVERLERTNRRYRWGIVIVIFAAMIVGAAGAGDDVPDVIRARKFEVVNEEGTTLVALSGDEDGGTVTTSSAKGTTLVKLGADVDGNGFVTTSSSELDSSQPASVEPTDDTRSHNVTTPTIVIDNPEVVIISIKENNRGGWTSKLTTRSRMGSTSLLHISNNTMGGNGSVNGERFNYEVHR